MSTEKIFLIDVSDLNDNPASTPIDINTSNNSITENSAVDTLVGITAFSQDLDSSNNSITYSLLNDAGGLFKIDSVTGVVRVAMTGIDFETAYEHTLIVRASSSDGSYADQAFLVAVVNVVEGDNVELVGTGGNDQFDVRYVGSGTNSWTVNLNGLPLFSGVVPAGGRLVLLGTSGTDTITVFGRTSADTLVIDSSTVDVNGFVMAGYHMEQRNVRGEGGNDAIQVLGGGAAIDGGTGSDRLLGNDVGNQFSISGLNGGSLNVLSSFANIESLSGGNGDDLFSFFAGGSLTGQVQGGLGSDQLNYGTRSTAASVNLLSGSATSTGGWVGIESMIGSSSTGDVLVGRNVVNTWQIDGPNHGQINGGEFFFDGVENLTGSTQSDTFLFNNSLSRATGLVIGGGGSDTLNFSSLSEPIQINLSTSTADRVGAFASVESVIGSSTPLDSIVGIDGSNAWTIQAANQGTVRSFAFSGIENLVGGAGADTFTFANSSALLSGTIVGSGGVDTLLAANQNNAWTIDSLGGGTLNTIPFHMIENLTGSGSVDSFQVTGSGQLLGTLQAGSQGAGLRDVLSFANFGAAISVDLQARSGPGVGLFVGIEELRGATGHSSSLLGADAATNWSVTGANSGSVGATAFAQFDRLVGGVFNDTFSIASGGSISGMIDGGDGSDTVTGSAIDSNWQILGQDQGRLEAASSSTLFQNVENLNAGSAIDAFVFSPAGVLTGTINGGAGAGADTLDLTQSISPLEIINTAIKSVTNVVGGFTAIEQVLAGNEPADRIIGSNVNATWQLNASGQVTLSSVTYTGLDIVQGGSATDTLVGPNVAVSWTIDSVNAGEIDVGARILRFESMENLTGGTASDSFEISSTGQLTGNLNGGAGTGLNSLSYEAWSSNVSVNLSTAVSGNATAVSGVTNNLTIVTGGTGNDTLTGNSGRNSVLIGGSGNDILAGLSARDILIGGLGSDTITGLGGEDILIAGRTQHDNDRAALLAIVAEWTSTLRNFSTRVSNLFGTGTGTRLNGSTFLNVDSVFNDPESVDSLTGGTSSDWFFADAPEITDFVTIGANADRRN